MELDQKSKYYYYKQTFLYSLLVACVITIPFIIVEWAKTGHPIFLYYGDYNAQQIAFYKHAVECVRTGSMRWDWLTDLGSNFVGSYSYYMLGSPFFWFMCLFPSSWAPYLMGPVYIIKYVCAAMTAHVYLQRFVKNKEYAVIGALLYAFCGFQIYNTFFNQFHEVVVLFPLLLIGMEELVNNDRRGLFAVAVALNAMCNYFMFAGQVAFCIMYFFVRLFAKDFKITIGKFVSLIFESVVGVLISMCLFLPGGLALVGNNRLDRAFSTEPDKIINMFVYHTSGHPYWYRYGHILESLFFPPDIPSRTNFFYGHSERWASNAAYLPMFGLTGLFALIGKKKTRTWLKVLCVFLIICMFVPVLNSSFVLLNTSYYARWIYMALLMLALATIIALDDPKVRFKGAILTYLAASAAIFIPLGMRWYSDVEKSELNFTLGSAPFPVRFWLCVLVVLASCLFMWIMFTRRRNDKMFAKTLTCGLCCVIVFYSAVHITNGKQHSHASDFMVDRVINGNVQFNDDDTAFYRMDQYRDDKTSTLDNLGLYWGYPSIECFHTVVPPSIMNFYPKIGVTRSVGSRAETKLYGLRGFTSVKYSVVNKSSTKKHQTDGWTYYDTQAGFDIYKNDNFIDMGFYYTEFMTETQFEKVSKSNRHALLCRYLVVPDAEADYYRQFMTEVKYKGEGYVEPNYSNYVDSVEDRRECTVDNFEYDSKGFKANISLESPQIVFFSVPDEQSVKITLLGHTIDLGGGWTASVNGKAVDVKTVTYGFMAVECPQGENTIEFSYTTSGLPTGLLVTGIGIVILVVYLFIAHKRGIKTKAKLLDDVYYSEDEEPATEAVVEAEVEAEVETEPETETESETETEAEFEPEPETEPEPEQNDGYSKKRRICLFIASVLLVALILTFVLVIMYFTNNHK